MKINIIAIGKCKKNSPEYAIIEERLTYSSIIAYSGEFFLHLPMAIIFIFIYKPPC